MPSALVRVVLIALAVCAVVVGAHALRVDHRCAEVKAQAQDGPAAGLGRIAGAALARCGDPRDRAIVSLVLFNRGHRGAAVRVARAMTVDNPDDYIGWLAVYRLTGNQRALAQVRRLNPRGAPSP